MVEEVNHHINILITLLEKACDEAVKLHREAEGLS